MDVVGAFAVAAKKAAIPTMAYAPDPAVQSGKRPLASEPKAPPSIAPM